MKKSDENVILRKQQQIDSKSGHLYQPQINKKSQQIMKYKKSNFALPTYADYYHGTPKA